MLLRIEEAKTPKQAWDTFASLFGKSARTHVYFRVFLIHEDRLSRVV